MPIKIPSDLPARAVLEKEGVPIIGDDQAMLQDIRPLRIAVLNLMPLKQKTETQLARVLGATPLQIEMHLLALTTHKPKTVDDPGHGPEVRRADRHRCAHRTTAVRSRHLLG